MSDSLGRFLLTQPHENSIPGDYQGFLFEFVMLINLVVKTTARNRERERERDPLMIHSDYDAIGN